MEETERIFCERSYFPVKNTHKILYYGYYATINIQKLKIERNEYLG